jgi:DNA-binding transcriptional LysR family regulator
VDTLYSAPDNRRVNWDDYDVFCRVIECGGFSAAARQMDRPRSSVSASVMRLEQQLKARLLERTTRRVRMTEAGEALYQSVGPLFMRLREAHSEVAAHVDTVAGTLRIASPYEFGAHHLAAVACDMMARHPELYVEIDVEHAAISPLDRRYDIVFSMLDRELLAAGTIVKRVYSLQPGLFASPRLLAERDAVVRPDDLADLPLLATSTDTAWAFIGPDGGRESVAIVAPRLRSPNAGVRLQAAVAGLGVARITATYCEDAVRAGTLQPVLADYACVPIPVHALLPGRRHMPAKVRAFLDGLSVRLPD